jgi:hypothetical protein
MATGRGPGGADGGGAARSPFRTGMAGGLPPWMRGGRADARNALVYLSPPAAVHRPWGVLNPHCVPGLHSVYAVLHPAAHGGRIATRDITHETSVPDRREIAHRRWFPSAPSTARVLRRVRSAVLAGVVGNLFNWRNDALEDLAREAAGRAGCRGSGSHARSARPQWRDGKVRNVAAARGRTAPATMLREFFFGGFRRTERPANRRRTHRPTNARRLTMCQPRSGLRVHLVLATRRRCWRSTACGC